MSDNVVLSAAVGTGDTVAADEISSAKYQRIKLIHGADGVNDGDVATGNPLPARLYLGTTAVSAGAGAVDTGTPRVTHASDDPAVTALQVMDDWDESDRAKVNPIVGQAGVAAGAGAVSATTQRATLASDDPAVTALQVIDDWDESDRAKVNPIVGQAGVAAGSGNVGATVQRVVIATDQPALTNALLVTPGGNVAHDAVDSGNPLKIGGKVSTSTPTPVSAADRTDAWFDQYGRLVVSDRDVETGLTIGTTGLRDRLTAERYTVLADSLADGLAGFWTSTTANGGTTTSSGGEGLIQSSTGPTGSAQLSSTAVTYFPGQVGWFNSAVRFGDTGSANNTRRIGAFTVSGTTPQDGFYYELSGTTLNAVICKSGTPTAVASTSWSEVSIAPFTLDTNYHSFEIRYTANTVWFYVDNQLRHRVSGTTSSITATLNFPITIHTINTSGASNRLIAVRNCGIGRFGSPMQPVAETGLSAVFAVAVGGGTPHDSVDSGNPLKLGGYAKATAPSSVADGDRVNAWFSQTGALNVADAGGSLTVDAAGDVAHDAADSGNPIKQGAKATTALSGVTLVSNADRTDLYAGVDGVQIVRPHCNLEDVVQERTTNTDGASTAFASGLAAPGSGVRLWITKVTIANSSSSFCTVDLRDGSGGSVLWTLPVPATGGVIETFNPPLRLTANTALAFDASAATSTLSVSAQGFKSKV